MRDKGHCALIKVPVQQENTKNYMKHLLKRERCT